MAHPRRPASYDCRRRVAVGPDGVRGKHREANVACGPPPTAPRASHHRASVTTYGRPRGGLRRSGTTPIPELAICLDCGAMIAPPSSGPMVCASCLAARPVTARKRSHEERRSSPDALARRAEARRFYSSARWRRTRDAIRKRDGACVACGSVERLTVDHIVPRTEAPALAFEPGNLRTLCASCHGKRDGHRSKAAKARRSPLTRSQVVPSVLGGGGLARPEGKPRRGAYASAERPPVVA